MEKISIHGKEIARYFSTKYCGLISIRANGVTLIQYPDTDWEVLSYKREDASLENWTKGKLEFVAELPEWKVGIKSLPSLDTIAEWMGDSICETVTGEIIEPDGVGSDGAPSWLLALGLM